MSILLKLSCLSILALSVLGCDSEPTDTASNNRTANQNEQAQLAQKAISKPIKSKRHLEAPKTLAINRKSGADPFKKDPYYFNQDYADSTSDEQYDRERYYYLEQLKHSTDPDLRIQAIDELDESDIIGILPSLQNAMNDPEPAVRIKLVEKFSEIELYGAIESIVKALDDPEPEVVLSAISAIENIADESLIFKLEPLLQDPNDKIQQRAEEVIEMLN